MGLKVKNEVSVDQMAELLKIRTPSDYMDRIGPDSTYNEAFSFKREELAEDSDYEHSTAEEIENLACIFAEEQEIKAQSEIYNNYCDAVVDTFHKFLNFHCLALEVIENSRGTRYFVVPANQYTWRDGARSIMNTINGVGNFYFSHLKDFLCSGPYSPKQAVMEHLHWLRRYSDVYGEKSPSGFIAQLR